MSHMWLVVRSESSGLVESKADSKSGAGGGGGTFASRPAAAADPESDDDEDMFGPDDGDDMV